MWKGSINHEVFELISYKSVMLLPVNELVKMMKYHLKRELWLCHYRVTLRVYLKNKSWKGETSMFFPIQVMPVQKQKCGAPRYRSPGPLLYWQYGWPSCSSFVILSYSHHLVLAIRLSIMFIIHLCHYRWHHHCHHPVLANLFLHQNYQSFGCCHCHDFSIGG